MPSHLKELFKSLYLTVSIDFDGNNWETNLELMDPRDLNAFVFVISCNK